MNKRLKNKLEKYYKLQSSKPEYKIGALNDLILADIIKRIRRKPSLDNFIQFTNCLNFFYSTRLQAAVDTDKRILATKNKIIVQVAKILKNNWQNGVMINSEKSGGEVNVKKVEKIRVALKKKLDRGAYSFSTKVFHQLNHHYPIIDANVNRFMSKHKYKEGINFYNDKNTYSDFYTRYLTMMKDLKYRKNQVNKIDNSIWVYISLEK